MLTENSILIKRKKKKIHYKLFVVDSKKNVTATGFKPVTPTSVVWYSIQLSYAAISLLLRVQR